MGVLIHFDSYCQNDSIIKSGYVTMATLIVDFDTYKFEGGTVSYYSCSDCASDSIPLTIDYHAPGDIGRITFTLSSLQDTIFDALLFWGGTGLIYFPTELSTQAPFTGGNSEFNKPTGLRYINYDGGTITDTYYINQANSAWSRIDQMTITKLFTEKGFKSAIYLFGVYDLTSAKWIIFLYHNDQIDAINSDKSQSTQIQITPNPANEMVRIDLHSKNQDKISYSVFNQLGQSVFKGEFWGSTCQFDLSMLKPGLYFLHLSDVNNMAIATKKIIIE